MTTIPTSQRTQSSDLPSRGAPRPLRILYSFPHRLGADRICTTAWHQVDGVAAAGADVVVHAGSISRELPGSIAVRPTLAWGSLRLPYRILGTRKTCILHDWIVAQRLTRLAGEIDLVHTWPLGALRTLRTAARLGIPTVLERPNAHTRFAYEVVDSECKSLGISMPPGHEHAYDPVILKHEEEEYAVAHRLLCPSDFVVKTFLAGGFDSPQMLRHQYGFDHNKFSSAPSLLEQNSQFTMIFVGGCAPRKGLHYALEAWLKSIASRDGKFLIVGNFIPGYGERLAGALSHPSVEVLGFRRDIPELMRKAHVLTLPSIEEGSALVTSEARGCGCVLLVSEATGAMCQHGEDSFVHAVGDVAALSEHITALYQDRNLYSRMRVQSLRTVDELTWAAAGRRLLDAYYQALAAFRPTGRAVSQ